MGEAVYYLKARFESNEAAQEALSKVDDFLQRCRECEDDWQANRPGDPVEAKKALEELKADYPDVFEGLGIIGAPDNELCGLNFLAGKICPPPVDDEPWMAGDVIGFSGMVWHFADWSGFEHYMKSIGAVAVGWLSDEDCNLFDAIKLD